MRPYQRRELQFCEASESLAVDSNRPVDSNKLVLGDRMPRCDLPLWQTVARYSYAQFSLSRSDNDCGSFAFEFIPRWVPRFASRWDVLLDTSRPRVKERECHVYYSFPMRTPGFMAVQYLVCGQETPYATLRRSVEIVSWIARARGCQAVVCQAISDRLSERVMKRWGYVPHAKTLGPGHYILRLRETR